LESADTDQEEDDLEIPAFLRRQKNWWSSKK
jgi:cell division protein FtsZ